MPIYEYECEACGHRKEALQKISDEPLTDCPECGQDELRKLVSAPSFRLKGNGWYETDFKDGSKKNQTDSGKSTDADASAKTTASDSACCGSGKGCSH
ncbi:MAG: zinc ribbon domain-containing protein [Gammaproteobacteria bacterium]|nr:MAG: zinc ribbon domain-containing protein [Gammaproteobacteria bacterium]